MNAVREVNVRDLGNWLTMRAELWPEDSESDHRSEIDEFFAGEFPRWEWTCLVAVDEAQRAIGFAEVSIRPYAFGCESLRVAYLEGWFVAADCRKRGVGRALVAACEQWGREQGCTEFGSDVDLENEVSRAAHTALGFTDVGLVRAFRKDL